MVASQAGALIETQVPFRCGSSSVAAAGSEPAIGNAYSPSLLSRTRGWDLPGAPGEHGDGYLDGLRRAVRVTDPAQQQFRGEFAQRGRVLGDDSDAGVQQFGERDVVESDVRDDPLRAHVLQCHPGPDGQQVLRGE